MIGDVFARNWIRTLKSGDHAALMGMFSSECRFESPVVHKVYTDFETISRLLLLIPTVLTQLTYINVYISTPQEVRRIVHDNYTAIPNAAAYVVLHFTAVIESDGKTIRAEGADYFTLDSSGKVIHLKVMIRPIKAIVALSKKMGNALSKM